MSQNDSKTRAFETVHNSGLQSKISRQKLVIAIFVIIILILLAFATLIIGNILSQLDGDFLPINPPSRDVDDVPKDSGDVNVGSLLFINDEFLYEMPSEFENMINLFVYRKNSENIDKIEINGYLTYSLSADRIALDKTALDAFNLMILDYCKTLDLSGASQNSASNLVVAWGGYTSSTLHEYNEDITNIGKDYYDHGLGTTVTLKSYQPSEAITEDILKKDFTWIYENAHKYGFILRFPNACKDHTGFDSTKRVHLRYVGEVHATYMYENGLCLEKYLETLRAHSVNDPIYVNVNGKTYEIYYVAHSGNPTNVPVPKEAASYTISGDNMHGFIVTAEK